MDPLNEHLRAAFLFQPADLRANRAGRLSRRQQTLLATARSTSWWALAVFVLVMAGTGGLIALSVAQTPGRPAPLPAGGAQASSLPVTAAFIAAAILGVIIVGVAVSRRYIAAFNPRQIRVAEGRAEIAADRENNWQVQIGPTRLRLAAPTQLAAFRPGIVYRVYYLAGPVPNILSAEAANTPAGETAEASAPPDPAVPDPTIQVARGARLVLVLLGLLTLEIPIVAFAVASLPEYARWLVMIALLLEALGFIWFALWRLLR